MRFVFVLLWVGMSCACLAQPMFNRTYSLGHPITMIERAIVHSDTIISYGITFNNTPPYKQCLFVARFDSNGVVLDHNLICDSLGGHLTMAINWSKIIATSDHGYALTAAPFSRNAGMMVKLRNDLSVEFVREYANTAGLVDFYNAVIELPDGYLLGGYVQTPNYLIRPFLRRVDKQGETVWLSFYGEYGVTDLFTSYFRLNDDLIVFAGSHRPPPGTEAEHSPWIAIVDTDGQIIKEWRPHPSEVPIGGILSILPVNTNLWFVRGINVVGNTNYKYEPYFALLDTNFLIQSMRPYDVPRSYLSHFWSIAPTSDGNYIAAGQVNAVDPNNEPASVYGWLYKVSPELDSLWSHRLIPPQAGSPGGYFGGVGVLSSGNMVAGGYAPLGNEVYGWLVKFTPDGCVDTLWCGVSSAWDVPETQLREPPARVYPNPTTGQFFVSLPEGSGPVRLALHRSDGHLVLEQQITAATTVDASHLPPGIYFCRVADAAGVLLVTKLVVSR